MQIFSFSLNFHPLVLASFSGSCLQQLWLWYSNGNFLFSCFLRWGVLELVWMVMEWWRGRGWRTNEDSLWKSGRGWEPELSVRFAFDGKRPQVLHCGRRVGRGAGGRHGPAYRLEGMLVISSQYPWHLALALAQNGLSVNVCWMNEKWMRESRKPTLKE